MRNLILSAMLAFVLLLVAVPASSAGSAGVDPNTSEPSVCAWVDPGQDVGYEVCVQPNDSDCLVWIYRETIFGGYDQCVPS